MEWAVRYDNIFFTQAGGDTEDSMTTCTKLHNGLCVGWYQYLTYNDLTSHRRAIGSSYLNDASGLERPHLLGPGMWQSTNGYEQLPYPPADISNGTLGWLDAQAGGSSFSAPAVLSAQIDILLYEGFFSEASIPEGNKAIVLAGTVDSNADGAIGKGNTWSGQPSDAQDGAGQIDFTYIKQILDNNQYFGANLVNASFVSCGTGCREYTVGSITIPTGKSKARVALVWNACSVSRTSTAFLNNDLDLLIQRSPLCGSPTSNDVVSEIEMVEFSAGLACGSGTIKIRIKNGASLQSCGTDTTEPVAVAWSFR
jgi:hypothetical protein